LRLGWMGTAFSNGLNENGFFKWVEWGRLFHLGWMGMAFHLGWMGTAFSSGLNGNGFFIWVEWGRLFQMGWVGTAFSDGLNGDELYTLSHQLFLLTHLRSEVVNRLVYIVLKRDWNPNRVRSKIEIWVSRRRISDIVILSSFDVV
jgi:hypothetical protein